MYKKWRTNKCCQIFTKHVWHFARPLCHITEIRCKQDFTNKTTKRWWRKTFHFVLTGIDVNKIIKYFLFGRWALSFHFPSNWNSRWIWHFLLYIIRIYTSLFLFFARQLGFTIKICNFNNVNANKHLRRSIEHIFRQRSRELVMLFYFYDLFSSAALGLLLFFNLQKMQKDYKFVL